MTTINSTITLGGTPQWQAPLNASSSIVITNNAPGEQLIVASNGAPAGPLNGVIIYTSLTIDTTGNNPGLFPSFSNGAISIFGRNTGQSVSIVYS
jgi:hypothetical protein